MNGLGELLERYGKWLIGHPAQLLAAFMIAFSLVCLSFLLLALLRSRASLQWPNTQGTVLKSFVERDCEPHYHARITYEYQVGQQLYTSDVVTYDARELTEGAARATASRYPPASAVTVFYDPARPGVSVLEPGASYRHFFIALSACLALGAFGIWMVLSAV